MGGCRCVFRECGNNTINSPGVHFFHFPIRDMPRCLKWAHYSDKPSFVELPADKLKNKVVCQHHFQDRCFMNFKKERLVKWAIPTMSFKESKTIDHELIEADRYVGNEDDDDDVSDHQRAISLTVEKEKEKEREKEKEKEKEKGKEKEKEKTLSPKTSIAEPPVLLNKNVQVLHNTRSSPKSGKVLIDMKMEIMAQNSSSQIKTAVFRKRSATGELKTFKSKQVALPLPLPSPIDVAKFKAAQKPRRAPIILNENFVSCGGSLKYMPVEVSNSDAVVEKIKPQKEVPPRKKIKEERTEIECQKKTVPYVDISTNVSTNEEFECSQSGLNSFVVEEQETPIISDTSVERTASSDSSYAEVIAKHGKQIEEIKQLLNEKYATLNVKKEVAVSSATHAARSESANRSSTAGLNKQQLFNAIKKYLNPSLVALLRMELFGNSEREWRSDEKNLAVELYNCGSNFYDFVRDEWRVRLPSKATVLQWMNESSHTQSVDTVEEW